LNTFVTFRPINIDALTGIEHCRIFDKLRKKLDQYARQYRFPLTIAWARESAEDGTGEHLHCLVHIPPKRFKHFKVTTLGWLPADDAIEYLRPVDVRSAHQGTIFTKARKR